MMVVAWWSEIGSFILLSEFNVNDFTTMIRFHMHTGELMPKIRFWNFSSKSSYCKILLEKIAFTHYFHSTKLSRCWHVNLSHAIESESWKYTMQWTVQPSCNRFICWVSSLHHGTSADIVCCQNSWKIACSDWFSESQLDSRLRIHPTFHLIIIVIAPH
jgi:hypothetical protein